MSRICMLLLAVDPRTSRIRCVNMEAWGKLSLEMLPRARRSQGDFIENTVSWSRQQGAR
jgi:hypothetical protein